MPGFQDRVFLVTGASSGIGRAIAHALVQAGASVALMARSQDKLLALQAEWGGPARVHVVAGDVTQAADCQTAVTDTVTAFGKLDGLVHSAGVSMRGRVAETQPAVFRELMEINYLSTVVLFQAALPHLTTSRGHFAVISSVVGKFAPPYRGGYAASKHAVQALMDAARIEVAPLGVHVLTVCPGFVKTDVSLNALTTDGSKHNRMDADIANGLDPADVARQVLDALQARKREIAPAGPVEWTAICLSRWAPWLLDKVLARRLATDAALVD